MSGIIKSLMFIPDPVDAPEVDMPLVAVIIDKISLNEEMMSAVDEVVFLDSRLVPALRREVDEIW